MENNNELKSSVINKYMEKYLFINWAKYSPLEHIKIKDFIKILNKNDKIKFINTSNENIKDFIIKHIHKNYLLVFPFYIYYKYGGNPYIPFYTDMRNIAVFIDELYRVKGKNDIKLKFVFNSVDPVFGTIHSSYLKTVFSSQNIHLILTLENLEDMKIFCKTEYTYLTNKNLYFSGINYCYSATTFNSNPINKISLSGDKRNGCYTERYIFDKFMSQYPNKYEYLLYNKNELQNDTDFMQRLNKYICSFYAAHDIYHNSGILHKIFEILGSGTLLLASYKGIKIYDLLGLKQDIHYIVLQKGESIIQKVNFILDIQNREYINKIRKKGQHYCITNLDAAYLYKKYIKILDDINNQT